MKFNLNLAKMYGVGPALVIEYIVNNNGKMSVKDLRRKMSLPYTNALRYLMVTQEKGLIIGKGEPTKSLRYENYEVVPSVLEIEGKYINRKEV